MKVKELMTQNAECIRLDATLQQAAERMKALDIGSLPVCDNDRLVGVLTDRDIVIRCVSEGHDPRTDRVRDVMTPVPEHWGWRMIVHLCRHGHS